MELGNDIKIYSVTKYMNVFGIFHHHYRSRDKRNAALISIVNEMNINDFGVTELKNKIKNLRST